MEFDRALVRRLAHLSRLSLSGDEEELAGELGLMAEYLQRLSGTPAGEGAWTGPMNEMREDRAGQSLPREELLAPAPAADGAHFLVPRTVE